MRVLNLQDILINSEKRLYENRNGTEQYINAENRQLGIERSNSIYDVKENEVKGIIGKNNAIKERRDGEYSKKNDINVKSAPIGLK